ncbi:MAG: type II toxin-antitoxin system VapC family toxin [Candidatus Omnitrophica bacterium]|nr:type II toxin-antitoxin system VapC family toxin [Candidatus Omnitrophota bacterium]MCA9426640.1 type II toxin-antitoxin system VapC family toxin [Candidatus Omnitrophota bacterium]
MSWCFEDESSEYADKVLESLENCEAVVPSIWPLEVGNVLLVAERRNRIDEASSTHFLEILNALPIQVEPEPPDRIFTRILSLARKHEMSTYDASYLDLALRLDVQIATLDESLRRTTKKERTEIYDPGEVL